MRQIVSFLAGLLICFALSASAETFVLKSGKKIEGTIRYEEQDVLRIVDSSGIPMNLRKATLDYEAMNRINTPGPAPDIPAQRIAQQPVGRHGVVYTNNNIGTYARRNFSVPTGELKTRLRHAEEEFNRLKAACRAAGQSSPSTVVWNSTTYVVNGKPVTVAGYWAHPDNVAKAKRICESAIRAEQELKELKQASDGRNTAAGAP